MMTGLCCSCFKYNPNYGHMETDGFAKWRNVWGCRGAPLAPVTECPYGTFEKYPFGFWVYFSCKTVLWVLLAAVVVWAVVDCFS